MAGYSPAVITIELRAFLQASASRKFNWISCNCGFWVCEWINRSAGIDPVEAFRGRFKTAAGFQRHVMQVGGNEAFSRWIASAAGLEETDEPRLGDVGLVATGEGATMAIKCAGRDWACKTQHGIAIGPFEQIAAWRL